jgi:hypothetical protein
MRTLTLRGLVEEAGTEHETGAILYRTTGYFLERLGLPSLDYLPDLAPFLPDEIEDADGAEEDASDIARAPGPGAAANGGALDSGGAMDPGGSLRSGGSPDPGGSLDSGGAVDSGGAPDPGGAKEPESARDAQDADDAGDERTSP